MKWVRGEITQTEVKKEFKKNYDWLRELRDNTESTNVHISDPRRRKDRERNKEYF